MLINHEESKRVADIVNFNYQESGLAQSCFDESLYFNYNGLNDIQSFHIRFYMALGLFVWLKYDENEELIPKDIIEWYMRNTALMSNDKYFIDTADE